jgi:hypothetical protein
MVNAGVEVEAELEPHRVDPARANLTGYHRADEKGREDGERWASGVTR